MSWMFSEHELNERIELNYRRLLCDPYYGIDEVFAPADYDWYGDKEGRALLAFVCHYKMHGRRIPCMDEMIVRYPSMANEQLFFGPLAGEVIHEQQLSGHSWLLRGLCEYYEQFSDPFVLEIVNSICQNLYLPTAGRYKSYPIDRTKKSEGGVSGSTVGHVDGWELSSDIGCAFMSIDGLSHAYAVSRDARVLALLDEMIGVYLAIDKRALRAQTHCTLTAARGMMRLYSVTGEGRYLDGARAIFELYTKGGGMTATYQNVNWWGRCDTWTEPCAIVDAMMLAALLYRAEGKEEDRRIAARIYHNGLATAQRDNGGAGTDTVVTREEGGTDTLRALMYEAYFCCTMRLAEGLWFVRENKSLFAAQVTGTVRREENGSYMDGDILYAEITGADRYLLTPAVAIDGHLLHPLLKAYTVPREQLHAIAQRVLFP